MRRAAYERALWSNDYIGTEHILLSLVRDCINPAAQFLERFYPIPITIAGMPVAVKRVCGWGGRRFAGGGMTPNAERLVLDAQIAAGALSRDFVGSEHLLLAMLANRDCAAARALSKRVDLDCLAGDLRKSFRD